MPKIRFLRDYVVKKNSPREDDPLNPKYKTGKEMIVSDASARHFVNRGAAEIIGADSPAKAPAAETSDADKTASKDGDGANKSPAGSGGPGGGSGKSR